MSAATQTFDILDDRFDTCVKSSARVEKLYEGCRWAEGPAYFAAGRYLVWSDIPNDRMLRWDEATGAVSLFRSPAGHSNVYTSLHVGIVAAVYPR
ncbi:MAG TPA: SMP-30/gluconolactonase/LRE family protein, partial [Actinopolymorphaceae bacterium]|nr:SMP-30/gluconolactonase/LRE family protein [Actinopolymorphaceae bacterium]